MVFPFFRLVFAMEYLENNAGYWGNATEYSILSANFIHFCTLYRYTYESFHIELNIINNVKNFLFHFEHYIKIYLSAAAFPTCYVFYENKDSNLTDDIKDKMAFDGIIKGKLLHVRMNFFIQSKICYMKSAFDRNLVIRKDLFKFEHFSAKLFLDMEIYSEPKYR